MQECDFGSCFIIALVMLGMFSSMHVLEKGIWKSVLYREVVPFSEGSLLSSLASFFFRAEGVKSEKL